ncbi:hypothetical protein KSB_30090 [Ktedonobacter robiniae]|uniref:Uncharacterized protein n=1 Tax=Ktedonobacter robiniae TaxID=2778365 RepID=A0ABQ3UP58_9CHLR|nr:hypothetical protein KSB_30090 [Ktedonobacter robiniae]
MPAILRTDVSALSAQTISIAEVERQNFSFLAIFQETYIDLPQLRGHYILWG